MGKMLAAAIIVSMFTDPTCEMVHVDPADQAIVDDAFFRLDSRVTKEPRGYFAIVIQVGENRCVHLRPRPRTLGPSPTYCYDSSGEFVAVYGRP